MEYDAESSSAKIEQQPMKFMLAGKAFFTLRSTKTGNRFTYKVVRATDKDTNEPINLWFVSFLTGPDNWANYTYIGVIREVVKAPSISVYEFHTSQKSKLPVDAPPCKAIIYVIDCLQSRPDAPGAEIWHAGRCGRCGRMLTVPESIASGFGPECESLI